MKTVVLLCFLWKIHPPVRPRPPVRLSARAGAGRTYIHKTPDRPPWAAVTRKEPANVFARADYHLGNFHFGNYLGIVDLEFSGH